MGNISIWGKYQGSVEKIDTATTAKQAQYLAAEYRLAFGRDWMVWAGRRDQEPRECTCEQRSTGSWPPKRY